jgi:hypothetical protein
VPLSFPGDWQGKAQTGDWVDDRSPIRDSLLATANTYAMIGDHTESESFQYPSRQDQDDTFPDIRE